jgi:hypothetical protein
MESDKLESSVQDEQFGNGSETTENTEKSSPGEVTPLAKSLEDKNVTKNKKKTTKEKIKKENKKEEDLSEQDEIDEHVLLPEDLMVPEELIDEDEEHLEESHTEELSTDYSACSKEELISIAEKLLKEKPVESIKADIDNIKIQFYKKHKADFEKLRKQYVENGGKLEEFKPESDHLEEKLKEILKQYKDVKAEYTRKTEAEKTDNLKIKQNIIEEIKVLINGTESLNDTFHQFRELQKKWRSVGPVPQSELNNLWENYNHHVEKFYDFIKINKELRDLDLKKNLEAKIEICEKAEELLLEPSVLKAFKLLQEYHNKWREAGPVPNEIRADIWNRFKEITSKINKRHQEYFENMKASQQKNLEAKTLLCEKAEDFLKTEVTVMKEWENKSKELIDVQNIWKSIGFAPKKDNTRIYQRFRLACDNFFTKKRSFYNKIKEEQNNNLQIKLDLCLQAEALKDSTEWKKSTEDLINIQKRWKEIGPVPRKASDQIWKRFRSACDTFFNNKSSFYTNIDSKYEDNLKLKLSLIEEIENYHLTEKIEENFTNLKDYQRRWTEIGFVPLKQKEEVQNRYRTAINRLFDSLKLDDGKKQILKYKSKIEHLNQNKKSDVKMNRERDKFIVRLKKLENDIVLWDNNIGFFTKSKNAEVMIKEVQSKIDSAKEEIKVLEEKIRMIDNLVVE